MMIEDPEMAMAKKMNFITSAVLGTIFVINGLVGNVLSISVWLRPKMRSSTGTYLVGQATADMGLLVFFFITDSIPMMAPDVHLSYSYGVFYSYIGHPFFFLFVVLSIWYTVGVTVDRYIQVCWIYQSRKMCSVGRALTGLGIITVLCFIINIPCFAAYEPVPLDERNATDKGYKVTTYGASKGNMGYDFWVHCMFLVLVPFATILVLNMLIVRQVTNINRHIDAKRGASGKEKAKKSEAQMTRLLLTVTFTFLVLVGLPCVPQCFFMLKAGNYRIVSEVFSIAKLGIVINSSINFYLYCLSARRFRKELHNVVLACLRGYEERTLLYALSNSTSSSTLKRSTLSNQSSVTI